jgi:hypothetical protein
MLSLLNFIGEAVRDAFDPRKTIAETPARTDELAVGHVVPASTGAATGGSGRRE